MIKLVWMTCYKLHFCTLRYVAYRKYWWTLVHKYVTRIPHTFSKRLSYGDNAHCSSVNSTAREDVVVPLKTTFLQGITGRRSIRATALQGLLKSKDRLRIALALILTPSYSILSTFGPKWFSFVPNVEGILTWIYLTRGGYALHLTHRTHRTLQVVRSYTSALHLTHRTHRTL
jgi:hypothetical protein